MIPFNQSSGPLSNDKYGNLEIQTYLVNKIIALQSSDTTNVLTYTMKNLKLHYLTSPDMKSKYD